MDNILREFVDRVIVPALLDKLRENPGQPVSDTTPWLTVKQAAERAQCGVKTLYREAHAGRIQAARIGGRRSLRFRAEWIDQWLQACSAFK
jgi:excisionase family DNA binding protein